MQRTLEAMRLEAQIAKDMDAYQKRPKRRFVGARAEEYRFARYVEDWRLKIERIGNLNYPEAAREQKLYGSLLLTVSIRADGSVENVEVNRIVGASHPRRRGGEDRRDVGAVRCRFRPTSSATPTSCTSRGRGRSPRATFCKASEIPVSTLDAAHRRGAPRGRAHVARVDRGPHRVVPLQPAARDRLHGAAHGRSAKPESGDALALHVGALREDLAAAEARDDRRRGREVRRARRLRLGRHPAGAARRTRRRAASWRAARRSRSSSRRTCSCRRRAATCARPRRR